MTKAGIERKATCRALFSKLLYLAESEKLAPSLDAATRRSVVQVCANVILPAASSISPIISVPSRSKSKQLWHFRTFMCPSPNIHMHTSTLNRRTYSEQQTATSISCVL